MLRRICITALILVAAGAIALAAEFTPAVTAGGLDRPQCQAFAGGKALGPAPDGMLEALLGLTPGQKAEWQTEPQLSKVLCFRIAFTQPVELGTIITNYSGGRTADSANPRQGTSVSYLKPDAPYPGDVSKPEQWVVLPTGMVKTLPPGVKTRALRFQDIQGEWGYGAGGDRFVARLSPFLLFQERYYSILNIGSSKVSGKRDGPKTWLGTWNEARPLAGIVVMNGQPGAAEVEALKSDVTAHPILTVAKDWKKFKPLPASGGPVAYPLDAPFPTRALRMTAGGFGNVFPLVNLGAATDIPGMEASRPPFTFRYNMPMDGFVALDIFDKKTNKRVRQLVAEVAREKGPVDEAWDLRDAHDSPLPPGEYVARGIARPPFKLTYQLTPYNAGQPPWWAPVKGGGGWMADHTPPNCATSIGDLVFLASSCNESGDGVIAVDHEGNKVWGEPYINGFDIAQRLTADDRYVYAIDPAQIQRIDTQLILHPEPKKDTAQTIYNFAYTRELPACSWDPTHGGIAARDGKLYVAFSAAPVSWLQTCFLSENLDPDKSFPRIWLAKGNGGRAGPLDDRVYGQETYDELMRFYAAFLVGSTPAKTKTWANEFLPSSTQAYFGDAPTEGGMAGNLVAAFKQPVTIGSVLVSEGRTQVYALKPGAQLPSEDPNAMGNDPDARDNIDNNNGLNEDDWIPLTPAGKGSGAVIYQAPTGGVKTQALRFKATRITFAMTMNRRFDDLAAQAERVYIEGKDAPGGGWALTRAPEKSVNQFNPAVMGMVWKQPVTLRGVGIVQPRGGIMAVDTYVGPAGGDPKTALADDTQWKELGRFAPEIYEGWFAQNPTLRTVDFGSLREVRALRIRALSPPCGRDALVGGAWPAGTNVCAGIVAFHSAGDDPAGLPVDLSQRITTYALPTDPKEMAKPVKETPFREPGHLVFDKAGTLYAESAGRIVTVKLDENGFPSGEGKEVVSADKLEQPSAMAFDAEGQLYVSDMGPQVVKVFDVKTGKLLRTIGKPGARKLGKWDDGYLDRPTGITVDSADKLWVTSEHWAPKRVSRWSRDGVCEKNFYGPTQYGGGGTMDEQDKSVLYYNGMKFVVDWEKLDWKLDSIVFRPGPGLSVAASAPNHAFYYKGHRYLVGGGGDRSVSGVFTERNNVAVPLAIAGPLANWGEISTRPELMQAFGSLDRAKYSFIWIDKNGDGVPQPEEIQTSDKVRMPNASVGEDLAINYDGGRLRPSGFLDNGTPLYDFAKAEALPLMSGNSWSNGQGQTFVMTNQWDRLLDTDGKTVLWDYFDEFAIFGGWYASGWGYDRPPGKLNAEQWIYGHLNGVKAKATTEDYWVTNSDQGDWFLFTNDGFLVGCIFGGPTGYGLRRWTMPDWTPGKVDLSDLRLQQECYAGDVVRANDGHVYAVAGKNHMSIVRVDGLEELERLTIPFTVTQQDVDKTHDWAVRQMTQAQVTQEQKAAKVPYLDAPVTVDGSLDDWPDDLFFTIQETHQIGFHMDKWVTLAEGALAYDENNLYVAVKALDGSPMKNAATDLKTLFKTGDAVDLQLALDPTADDKRTGPVPGDIRLLIARVKDQPVVMLYKYKDPKASPDKRTHFTSPVSELWVDDVEQVETATVGFSTTKSASGDGVCVEAVIPWKALGVAAPGIGSKLRGDLGLLQSDQNGVSTISRLYWSGKSQRVVSDLPSEARINPALWGEFYFVEAEKGMKFGPDDKDPLAGP